MTKWVKDQWPNNICSGFIRCDPSQTGGYIFRDASHGIPVLGHVTPNDVQLQGCKVVYHGSYPEQAEKIARRLTACWNAMHGLTLEEVEDLAATKIEHHKNFMLIRLTHTSPSARTIGVPGHSAPLPVEG